jgi:hypothetical protein
LPTDEPSSGPRWLERASCVIVGVIAGGAGGYVAFERSNQLGSAVLLVIGGVFLVIGIQGTRLMRFTSGSNIVELEQKKRIVADAIEKAQDEGNVEKASGIAEGAAIIAPSLNVVNSGLRYELEVASAIVGLGYLVTPAATYAGWDFIISDESGRKIYAELRRYLKPVPLPVVEALLYRAFSTRLAPMLLITYSELSRGAQEAVRAASIPFEVVQWRTDNDNAQLEDALRRTFASVPRTAADEG